MKGRILEMLFAMTLFQFLEEKKIMIREARRLVR